MQDIDAEINILNDIFSSDIVSPSAQKLVESSVDTLRSNIMEEITERVANVLYEKFELFDNFYSKRLKNFIRILKILGILLLKNWQKFQKILNFWKIFLMI